MQTLYVERLVQACGGSPCDLALAGGWGLGAIRGCPKRESVNRCKEDRILIEIDPSNANSGSRIS